MLSAFKNFAFIVLASISLVACSSLHRVNEPTFNEKQLTDQNARIQKGEDPYADLNSNEPSADAVQASLWAKSQGNPYLIRNQKAQKVGDLLTVLVLEDSKASTGAKTDAKRDSSLDIGASGGVGQGVASQIGVFGMKGAGKTELKGEGTTNRSGNFQATVQSVVENVLQNGTLFIRGKKVVTINNEDQEIELTGFVRPDDIRINNTVVSSAMADAKIRYIGNGVLSDKQRAGWGMRLVDAVWPF